MNVKQKNRYCIVGLGNHALNRIIPAITKSNSKLVALVTTKKLKKFNNIIYFKNLVHALKVLNKDTIIVLCSPPSVRARQIYLCLKNSFNIISEKPLFIDSKSLIKSYELIRNKNNHFIFENLMFLYSKTFNHFKKIYFNSKGNIDKISMSFLIPTFPLSSYRNQYSIIDNIIFDIACYPVSLINFLNLDLTNIEVKQKKIDDKLQSLKILIKTSKINKIEINVGLGKKYTNKLTLYLNTKKYNKILFDYFFYGLNRSKDIKYYSSSKMIKKFVYNDINAFTTIFNFSKLKFNAFKNSFNYSANNLHLMNAIKKLVNTSS